MSAALLWRLLDWVPFCIFIGLMIYFIRRMAKLQPAAAKQLNEHRERQIDEMHRINVNLERIVAALDARRTQDSRSIESAKDIHTPRA